MKLRPTVWGTAFSGLAVAFGAFGAHLLADRLNPAALEVYKTAVQYQMYHGLALIIVGILLKNKPSGGLANASVCFIIGVFLFSGSLYMITLGKVIHTDFKWLGPITPIGGLALLLGWGLMIHHHLTRR